MANNEPSRQELNLRLDEIARVYPGDSLKLRGLLHTGYPHDNTPPDLGVRQSLLEGLGEDLLDEAVVLWQRGRNFK